MRVRFTVMAGPASSRPLDDKGRPRGDLDGAASRSPGAGRPHGAAIGYVPALHMRIGVPKETAAGEHRVALVPEVVSKLKAKGLDVVVQGGAGAGALPPRAAYAA